MICTRCLMTDENDPDITFDIVGHCNYCRRHFDLASKIIKSEEAFVNIVKKIKKDQKNYDYDCLIGISGGIDSTSAVYYALQNNLRVLMVHVDNGWNKEVTNYNLRQIYRNTPYDLIRIKLDWQAFKDLQLSYLEANVVNVEIPTDLITKTVCYNYAFKNNIKYLLNGNNWNTESIIVPSWGYRNDDLTNLRAIHKAYGSYKIDTLPQISFLRSLYYTKIRKWLVPIHILNYYNYNPEEMMVLLRREWGILPYGNKHCESLFTEFCQQQLWPTKFGFDKERMHYSNQICAGIVTREEASLLIEIKPERKELLAKRMTVLGKLGLVENWWFDYSQYTENIPHEDYKTDKMIKRLKWLKRVIGK